VMYFLSESSLGEAEGMEKYWGRSMALEVE
jgi:hypothetical protein